MNFNFMGNHKESGQAIFEFLIFIPLLIYLFASVTTIGDAINGSINQQKVTRAYFYNLVAGNPYGLSVEDLNSYQEKGISAASLVALGWREKSGDGGDNYITCYPLQKFLGMSNPDDTCENPQVRDKKAGVIRVGTVYGICSGSFFYRDNKWSHGAPDARTCELRR